MARTYARIRVDIWRDDTWGTVSRDAQWLYLMILTQPSLSVVGCLVMRPGVWARLAGGEDRDHVRKWLAELEEAGLVSVDERTEEVVVRTFTTHDLVFRNQNLGRGVWGAWSAIDSEALRRVVVDNVPDEAWEIRFSAPHEARQMRCSGLE